MPVDLIAETEAGALAIARRRSRARPIERTEAGPGMPSSDEPGRLELHAEDGTSERETPGTLPVPRRLLDVPPAEPLDYAVDGLFVATAVNGIVGDGGAGKSTVIYAIAGAQAAGMCAVGDRVARPGPVLIVSGEDSDAVVKNRASAFAVGHRWDEAAMLANLHVYGPEDGVDLDDPRWQGRLIEAAADLKAVAAYFDPLVDLCGDRIDENSNSDAKRVTRYLRLLALKTGATPVLSMHVSKPAEGKSERKHRVRGAGAWKNATRSCWWVEPGAGGLELDNIKVNYARHGSIVRLKLTVATDPKHPLMWKSAHLAADTTEDVVTADVLTAMRWVKGCKAAPSSNEVEHGDHKLPKDRARAALGTARTKGWLTFTEGPRGAKLWSLSEAGHARLLLS